MLQDADQLERLVVLALVLEPLRHLTAFLMRRAREADPLSKNGLLDMLYEPVSPVVHAGQYIAAFLLHEPPRLQLLFHTRGCANFQEWSSKHPGAMRILRRCLLAAAASIHTRLVQPLKKKPWRL